MARPVSQQQVIQKNPQAPYNPSQGHAKQEIKPKVKMNIYFYKLALLLGITLLCVGALLVGIAVRRKAHTDFPIAIFVAGVVVTLLSAIGHCCASRPSKV